MWTILRKDLTIELRAKSGLATLFVLGILVLLIFAFALPDQPTPQAAAAALWISFVFAGTLGAQRTFLVERESACLQGLLTAPVDPGSIYLAKMLGTVVTLALLQAVTVPLTALFFGVAPAHPGRFALVCLLGNVGFASLATLFAAMAVGMRSRESVLPLLLFPLVVPVVMGAVKATAAALAPGPADAADAWISVLAAFGAVFTTTGWLLFEQVVRE